MTRRASLIVALLLAVHVSSIGCGEDAATRTTGITVSPTSGLETKEDGQTASFTIALDAEPTDDVVVALSSSDITEGTIDRSEVTFTTSNWATPQTVIVTGVGDDEADGDQTYQIVTAPAVSADDGYAGLDPANVQVTNLERDVGDTRTVDCTGLPESAEWYTATTITQTWDGTAWVPSSSGAPSAEPSETSCVYRCRGDLSTVAFYSLMDPSGEWDVAGERINDAFVINADGTGLTALTDGDDRFGTGGLVYSPDGTRLVGISDRPLDGGMEGDPVSRNVWVMAADGSEAEPLTENTVPGSSQMSAFADWSPTGDRILFVSFMNLDGEWDGGSAGAANIWSVAPDGTGLTPLTRNTTPGAWSWFQSFSLDGSVVVFHTVNDLSGEWDAAFTASTNIWRMDPDGSNMAPITRNTAAGLDSQFATPSPDGEWVAFWSLMDLDGEWDGTPTESYNLWLASIDGEERGPLTQNTLPGFDPIFGSSGQGEFSPDGETIAFEARLDLDGEWDGTPTDAINLWTINADGTGLTPLTRNTEAGIDSGRPHFSPDGSRIVFQSSMALSGEWDEPGLPCANLWIMEADGTGLRPLTENTTAESTSWGPNQPRGWHEPAECR